MRKGDIYLEIINIWFEKNVDFKIVMVMFEENVRNCFFFL